jgi:hypothetical protein
MKRFVAELQSSTPLSFGRNHDTPKLPRELEQAYEERTVLHKLHTAAGQIYIPPMAFKLCLEQTASYLGEQVPGKGAERYTKHYRQGVLCPEPVMLGITAEKVRIDKVFIPSQPGAPSQDGSGNGFPLLTSGWASYKLWRLMIFLRRTSFCDI